MRGKCGVGGVGEVRGKGGEKAMGRRGGWRVSRRSCRRARRDGYRGF